MPARSMPPAAGQQAGREFAFASSSPFGLHGKITDCVFPCINDGETCLLPQLSSRISELNTRVTDRVERGKVIDGNGRRDGDRSCAPSMSTRCLKPNTLRLLEFSKMFVAFTAYRCLGRFSYSGR
jgi:hypothetical protein